MHHIIHNAVIAHISQDFQIIIIYTSQNFRIYITKYSIYITRFSLIHHKIIAYTSQDIKYILQDIAHKSQDCRIFMYITKY